MELLHFTTCLNTSSLINLSGHQRMQQGFCPMGRHLCQVAQTSTLKKNGWFSITVIFLWTYKKKKKYELSSSDFDFHISEVSLSGKKKKKVNYEPALPHMPWLRHIQPPTRALLLTRSTVQPHQGLQKLLSSVGSAGSCQTISKQSLSPQIPQVPLTNPPPCCCPGADPSSQGVFPPDFTW